MVSVKLVSDVVKRTGEVTIYNNDVAVARHTIDAASNVHFDATALSVLPVDDFAITRELNRWYNVLSQWMGVAYKCPVDSKVEIKFNRKTDGIRNKFTINDILLTDQEWDKSDDTITLQAQPAVDLTWIEYGLWLDNMLKFESACRSF